MTEMQKVENFLFNLLSKPVDFIAGIKLYFEEPIILENWRTFDHDEKVLESIDGEISVKLDKLYVDEDGDLFADITGDSDSPDLMIEVLLDHPTIKWDGNGELISLTFDPNDLLQYTGPKEAFVV